MAYLSADIFKHKFFPAFVIIILVLIKATFAFKGARSFPDEYFYNYSLFFLDSIRNGVWKDAIYYLFNTGRPLASIFYLIPSACQAVLYQVAGIDPREPPSLISPIIFNLLVHGGLLLNFFYLIKSILKDNWMAFGGLIIYASLVNNNIYIRHLFPYDLSLWLFLTALLLLVRLISVENPDRIWGNKILFLSGVFTAASFLSYPGFYNGIIPVGLLTLFYCYQHSRYKIKTTSINLFSLGAGYLLPLISFELLAKTGQYSYFAKLSTLSGTIIQGDFDEGIVFPFNYLFSVEGLPGLILISGFVFYLLSYKKSLKISSVNILCFSLLLIYLYHAWSSFFGQKMVFYGRLLHIYFPFLVIGFLAFVNLFFRKTALKILTICSLISALAFIRFYVDYQKIAYPPDALWTYIHQQAGWYDHEIINEVREGTPFLPVNSSKFRTSEEISVHYKLVNCSFFHPILYKDKEYQLQSNEMILFSELHFQVFPAYQHEGMTRRERDILNRAIPHIKIIRTSR